MAIATRLPRGARLAATLSLAKRPQGVTSLEALENGAGGRLAANIGRLKEKGHRFSREWFTTPRGSRCMRYRWTGCGEGEEGNEPE